MEASLDPPLLWASGSVKLWISPLNVPPSVLQGLRQSLSADEQKRADTYRLPHMANAFTVRRSLLRVLLGKEFGRHPSSLHFAYNAFGKPVLASGGAYFSVSSSRDYAVWAFSPMLPVGVDIEWVDSQMPLAALIDDHFSRTEKKRFKETNGADERTDAFFRAWTGKEACAKATGMGLSASLDGYAVLDAKETCIGTPQGVFTVKSLQFCPNPAKSAYWVSLALLENE